jgi:hypothetical protein
LSHVLVIIRAVPRAGSVLWLLAGSLGAVGSGCKPTKTEIALTLKVEVETLRPEFAQLLWHGPGGRDIDRRVPEAGSLNTRGAVLGTVLIELDDVAAGERRVVVKGWKGDKVISGVGAFVPWMPGQRVEHTLVLHAWSDPDGDDLPAEVDPCPLIKGECPSESADAGEDGAGDDAVDADEDAVEAGGTESPDAAAPDDARPGYDPDAEAHI